VHAPVRAYIWIQQNGPADACAQRAIVSNHASGGATRPAARRRSSRPSSPRSVVLASSTRFAALVAPIPDRADHRTGQSPVLVTGPAIGVLLEATPTLARHRAVGQRQIRRLYRQHPGALQHFCGLATLPGRKDRHRWKTLHLPAPSSSPPLFKAYVKTCSRSQIRSVTSCVRTITDQGTTRWKNSIRTTGRRATAWKR